MLPASRRGGLFMQMSNKMEIDSNITVNNGKANIKNFGNGDTTVNGKITHTGTVKVISNNGQLYLGGTVQNNGGKFYASTGTNGTGMTISENFVARSAGPFLKDGTIAKEKESFEFRNNNGAKGINYKGDIGANAASINIVNKKGDLNINGEIQSLSEGKETILGNPNDPHAPGGYIERCGEINILNKGKSLILGDKADIEADGMWGTTKINNKGTGATVISKDAKLEYDVQLNGEWLPDDDSEREQYLSRYYK